MISGLEATELFFPVLDEERSRVKKRPYFFIGSMIITLIVWGLMLLVCCRAMVKIQKNQKRVFRAGVFSFILNLLLFAENCITLVYFGRRGFFLVKSDSSEKKLDGFLDFGVAAVDFAIICVCLYQFCGYVGFRRAVRHLKKLEMNQGFVEEESLTDLSVRDLNEKESFDNF